MVPWMKEAVLAQKEWVPVLKVGAEDVTQSGALRKGDVNANGSVTAFDASMALQAVVGSTTLSPRQQCAADYNGNGAVTAFDASLILQCVTGVHCSAEMCVAGAMCAS